jgi:hypothetical protein
MRPLSAKREPLGDQRHSAGAYLAGKASLGTLTPTKAEAPCAKHFHCTAPLITVVVAVGAGKAAGVAPVCVNGTSSKLPPPAAAVVVTVMAPVVLSMAMALTFLVLPGAA